MKEIVCRHLVPCMMLVLAGGLASAQDYVLTVKGDSLTGEVKPLLYGPEEKLQLVSHDKEKLTFSIFEVREFSSNGETYHPVKGERSYEFMKLIKSGYLSLYAYQMENQTRFDGLFMKKMDGQSMAVPNLGFKKYMGRFLEDCPAVAGRVESGEFGKKDLNEIIDAYNACVDSRTASHSTAAAARPPSSAKSNIWQSLEKKVAEYEFSGKADALEMITEVRKKIERGETIPNFLIEGLKSTLRDTGLSADLERALEETKP